MDRTEEFFSYVGAAEHIQDEQREACFYEAFDGTIKEMRKRLDASSSYKTVLRLEDGFVKLQKQIEAVLNAVNIEGTEDITMHYEGVKHILNQRMLALSKAIAAAKSKVSTEELELRPERPDNFREVGEDAVLERENRKITENQTYEVARSRIMKIEAVQKAINENLLIQDERIDAICSTTGNTAEIYNKISADGSIGGGSFARRAACIMLFCLSFVLLFLHYFYK